MPVVEVATAWLTASAIVFVFCLLALAIYAVTSFYLIYPPFALLLMSISALLYAVSYWARRNWRAQ